MAYNELIGTLGEQTAAWYKEECRRYAEAAEQSATDAGNSATAAERDAGIASDKADVATNKANLAGESADLAQEWAIKTDGMVGGIDYSAKHYAGQASGSATTASNKADEAGTSATNAEKWASYTNGTVDGTNYSAKQYALNAGNSATTASTKAGEASDSAQTASDKAGIATTQAGLAAGSALSASNSATLAEAWATKMDGMVDGDYSAKYYAGQASTSATNAGTSETNAGNSATLAEAWATKMDGMVAETDYSAKHYANEASNSASSASASAESAQQNADYIQASAVKIDIDDKRISNIEKLLQGNLYDYQTDTDSAYTKTVLAGAMPYASLEQIGGKTLVWNQLCQNEKPTSTANDLTFTNNGDGSWTINGTATAGSNKPFSTFATVSGHKYYIKACPSGGSLTTYYANISGLGSADTGNGVITAINSSANLNLRLVFSTGVTFDNVKIYPQCVDLTLLYGSGNEPSTVAEFQQMFPAQYYQYTQGQLLSAGVTEVVSVGKNLLNMKLFADTYPNNCTWNADTQTLSVTSWAGALFSTGIAVDIPANSIAQGTITNGTSVNARLFFAHEDGTATYLSSGSTVLLSKRVVAVKFNIGTTGTFTATNIQVEIGTTATTYSPYKETSYPIPAEIQALEGYGWSAGTVYNYIDFEAKKFVQRVGRVDLGTVGFSYNGTSDSFVTNNVSGITNPATMNLVCSKYIAGTIEGASATIASKPDKAIYRQPGNVNLFFRDTSFGTDKNAFETAINGTYLFYELQTPVETDISAYLTDDNLISVESGGTLTFPNSNGTDYQIPVPSSETYMVDLQSAI